jgi:hypothetical protein
VTTVAATADWVRKEREAAWRLGRDLRAQLLSWYCQEYGCVLPPPPALIVDELITDGLGAVLRFDPLPPDRFAQTQLQDGVVVVTINTLTGDIRGVKDEAGVQNVAKCHELIHVSEDRSELASTEGMLKLPGFEQPAAKVCLRGSGPRPGQFDRREFRAEEAGRAFAVSMPALQATEGFQRFHSVAQANDGEGTGAWRSLYGAATEIGVNISALVTQLEHEGLIYIVRQGRSRIFVTPRLEMEVGA